jgi:thioesterase domain-containing protein
MREAFPLADFMGVEAWSWSQEGLVVRAPAEPNVNVHGSMFGGSVAALGILAGWGWLHLELEARGATAAVVVQDERTRYLRPILGASRARCLPPDPGDLQRFLKALRRKGRGRLGLRVEISDDPPEAGEARGDAAAITEARFVATRGG